LGSSRFLFASECIPFFNGLWGDLAEKTETGPMRTRREGSALPAPSRAQKQRDTSVELWADAQSDCAVAARVGGVSSSVAVPLPEGATVYIGTRTGRQSAARMQDREYRREWRGGVDLHGRAGRFHNPGSAQYEMTI
jgi:hypothetical protein